MSTRSDSKDTTAPATGTGMGRRTMLRSAFAGAAALFVSACGKFEPKALQSAETSDLFARGGLSSPAGKVGSTVNVDFTMNNIGGVEIPYHWTATLQSQSAIMKFPGGIVPTGNEVLPVGGTVVRSFPVDVVAGNPGDTALVSVAVKGDGIPLQFTTAQATGSGPCATALVAAASGVFAQGGLSSPAGPVESTVDVDFTMRNLGDAVIPYHWSATIQSQEAAMEFPGGVIPMGDEVLPPGGTISRSFPVRVVAGHPGDTANVSVVVVGSGIPLQFTTAEIGQVGPCATATVASLAPFLQGTVTSPSGSVKSTVPVLFKLRNLGAVPIPYHWSAVLQSESAVVEFENGLVPGGDETLGVGETIERAFQVRIVAGNPGDKATVFARVDSAQVPLQFTSVEIGQVGPCGTIAVA